MLTNQTKAEVKYVANIRADMDEECVFDSKQAVDAFFKELPLHSSLEKDKILFVVDGMRSIIYEGKTQAYGDSTYAGRMRNYFIKEATSLGYEVIDMHPVFKEKYESEGIRFEFPTNGHWNETGHRLTSEQIKSSSVFKKLFDQ